MSAQQKYNETKICFTLAKRRHGFIPVLSLRHLSCFVTVLFHHADSFKTHDF